MGLFSHLAMSLLNKMYDVILVVVFIVSLSCLTASFIFPFGDEIDDNIF